jgi:hypothetical protein
MLCPIPRGHCDRPLLKLLSWNLSGDNEKSTKGLRKVGVPSKITMYVRSSLAYVNLHGTVSYIEVC